MTELVKLPPNAMQERPSALFADTAGEEDNLSAGIGQGYGILGYRGKVWTLRYHGNTYTIQDPQTGRPAQSIHCVILQAAANKSKSYYPQEEFDPNDNSGKRPICASLNGEVPDADIAPYDPATGKGKQSHSCVVCPRNQFYTNPKTGRPKRDCTDYKRLAVLLLPAYTRPLLGDDLLEPIFLRVPPASLKGLTQLTDLTHKAGWHRSWEYITEIKFAPVAWPEMVFNWAKKVVDAEVPVILEAKASPQTSRIIGGTLRQIASLSSHAPQPVTHEGHAQPNLSLMPGPAQPDMSLRDTGGSQKALHRDIMADTARPLTTDTGFGGFAPRVFHTIDVEATSTPPQPAPLSFKPTTEPSPEPSSVSPRGTSPMPPAPAPTPSAAMSSFGLGGAISAAPEPNTGTPPMPSQASTAPNSDIEEADADLDAAIAGVLKPQG